MSELSFYGELYSDDCPGCQRVEPQPPGLEYVFVNEFVRVHQDYAVPVPGMMVIETTRHVSSITELTLKELGAYNTAVTQTRLALRNAGIDLATFIQEERSSHLHGWWMPNPTGGIKIDQIKPTMKEAQATVTPEKIEQVETVTKAVKDFFDSNSS